MQHYVPSLMIRAVNTRNANVVAFAPGAYLDKQAGDKWKWSSSFELFRQGHALPVVSIALPQSVGRDVSHPRGSRCDFQPASSESAAHIFTYIAGRVVGSFLFLITNTTHGIHVLPVTPFQLSSSSPATI